MFDDRRAENVVQNINVLSGADGTLKERKQYDRKKEERRLSVAKLQCPNIMVGGIAISLNFRHLFASEVRDQRGRDVA